MGKPLGGAMPDVVVGGAEAVSPGGEKMLEPAWGALENREGEKEKVSSNARQLTS